jgi:hypothetical protein
VARSKADEYRAKALECERRAEQTADPFIKQQMLDVAQKWHTMAAFEEKYARSAASVGGLVFRPLWQQWARRALHS